MNEEKKYDWSYAVAFFLFDYPMLILADWITDGWHNIQWGATVIEAAIVFRGADTRFASNTEIQKERQYHQQMNISVFCS